MECYFKNCELLCCIPGNSHNIVCQLCCFCCCSVSQLCPTLCNPMDCSMPGLSVPYYLRKFAQVHVHCIGDAIQPSHPLMPSFPSALNLSQHQGLFQWFSCSHQMTKNTGFSASGSVLPTNIQGWCPLRFTGLISLLSKGLSRVFSINCTSIFLRLNYSCSFGFTTNLRGIYRNLWPPWCLRGKEFTCQCKRQGLGRSPGKGNGNPLKCSCLENPMDREACGVTELDTTWWLKQ